MHVLQGRAEVTVGGQRMSVEQGQVILMPAKVPYVVEVEERFKVMLTSVSRASPTIDKGDSLMDCGKQRSLVCSVVVTFALVLMAGPTSADEQPLMGPRPVYATTELVTDGNPGCTIIHADGAGYAELAQKIAARIQLKTGMGGRVLVLCSSQTTDQPYHLDDAYRSQHLIVLGNSANNVAYLALYANLRAMADSEWPGAGNYELRTACDPFWTGYNAIVLGSTDLAGVTAATEAMLAQFDALPDSPTLTLPRWCMVLIDGKDQVEGEMELGSYKAPAASRPAQLSFLRATVDSLVKTP